MTSDELLFAALTAVRAAAPVAFYLLCVRPALRWMRARPMALAAAGAASAIPSAAVITGTGQLVWLILATAATVVLVGAWIWPHGFVRLTGGPDEARTTLDLVLGYVFPAGRFLDVGDIERAEAQIVEARRVSSPATARYVDLWGLLVSEERMRRDGEEVSRSRRLEAIQAEYDRLVAAADPLRLPVILMIVFGMAVAAAVAELARGS